MRVPTSDELRLLREAATEVDTEWSARDCDAARELVPFGWLRVTTDEVWAELFHVTPAGELVLRVAPMVMT